MSIENTVNKRVTCKWLLPALVILVGLISGCSTAARNGKPAGTVTAIGVIQDQVEKGNIEVEGDTDTAPLP